MLGTQPNDRRPPARVFEEYVLTRLVDPNAGLTNVPGTFFTQVPGPSGLTKDDTFAGAGAPGTDDATSNVLPIGFDFSFDGVTYKEWCANTNGWMVLVDPSTGAFSSGEVLRGSVWINETINPTFTSQAVLLAPWFDDLRNGLNDPTQLSSAPFNYSTTKVNRIVEGLEPTPIFLNQSSYGLSYYNDVRSHQGRRLIVRWASISNYTSPSSAIRFEVVIYENGTIEYRYTPRLTISAAAAAYEGATCGIFMPNGTNRFRDFSTGLGYRVDARREYVYGGYVYDSSYIDVAPPGNEDFGFSSPYTSLLLPYYNWPGLRSSGCTMSFTPPKRRRKILPRRLTSVHDAMQSYPTVARTGDERLGTHRSTYDDRLSPNYAVGGVSIVNYPTTLPRFYGGDGQGTLQRQDLFSGDFLVTGSVVKSAIDQYVIERAPQVTQPFNEVAREEQSQQGLSDSFFVSGTQPTHVSNGFQQPLRSKTQVRFVMPIDTGTTMPGGSSSVYYYNVATHAWQVPARSTYVLATGGSTPPTPNPSGGGDTADPMVDATAGRIIEDARGFGPIGNLVSSGSHGPVGAGDQTDSAINSSYVFGSVASVLGKEYAKSLRSNAHYAAGPSETFSLPINAPFLIEKATFEIPLRAGPGWFQDLTQCFVPLVNSASFDFGGPGLTVALYRQVRLGTGPSAPTVRDIIMSGTITHVYDNTASVKLSNFDPTSTTFQIRPVGFLAYGGTPSAVIDDRGALQFTGSAHVTSTAFSTSGLDLVYRRSFTSSSAVNAAAVTQLMTKQVDLFLSASTAYPATSVNVGYVSPLGRAGLGLQQSGRSILGNEHVTWQGLTDQAASKVSNPFYVGDLDAQQVAALAGGSFSATASAVIPLRSHLPSPYLVMPGDTLVLSISKTRPVVYGGTTTFSGSMHDVVLAAGNVNITLYGSQVLNGSEFHDTQNQPLASNTVHEILGAEPVLDQFDVGYCNEYSGSFSDNVMLGALRARSTLSSSSGVPIKYVVVESTRDRYLSKLNARNVAQLGINAAEIALTPSKAFRAQPWWEMAGDVRTSQFVDATERYWDSMLPSVKDCFSADGCAIFVITPGAFGSSYQIDTGASGTLSFNPGTVRMGWAWLDYGLPSLLSLGYDKLINTNWNKAFPFEPRYRAASRQVNVERSFVATYLYGGPLVIHPIKPTQVYGLAFGTTSKATAIYNTNPGITLFPNEVCWDWLVDVNLSGKNVYGYYVTGSASPDDTIRGLFGFGDRNSYFSVNVSDVDVLLGSNHVVETRDAEGPHPDGVSSTYDNNFFRVSPRIRGWKYGIHSGLPTNTKAYWRRGSFGQFRDMLEQRPFTKFYQTSDNRAGASVRGGVQPAVVTVTFIDPSSGRLTAPSNTWSSNLDHECTSSLPYFDGLATNRPVVDPTILNLQPNVVRHDAMGNIHVA